MAFNHCLKTRTSELTFEILTKSLDDFQVVLSPIQGGPAQRAGILTGDELVQIDGKHISAYRSEVENTINYLIRTSTSLPDYASLRLQMWHLQA